MHRTLLTLACACLLACPGGDDTTDTEAATEGTTAGSGTGTATDAATGTSSGPGTSAGSGDATSMGSSGAPQDGTSTGGTDPMGACVIACEHLVKCGAARVPNCGIPCGNVGMTAAGCEDLYVAQQECVAALSCEDAQAWADAMGVGGDHPCAAEDVAYQACLEGA